MSILLFSSEFKNGAIANILNDRSGDEYLININELTLQICTILTYFFISNIFLWL